MNKNRIFRFGLILLAGLSLSALIAYAQISGDKASTGQTTSSGTDIGGAFSLVDQHGKPFTDKNLLGHYTLAYFGFTFCPAICPTELQRINVILKNLGPAGEKILPLFITIDPERDTQEAMATYVAQFNPRLTGLTGTRAQVDEALKAYKVYARKVQDPKMSDYTMDHSSYLYLIRPDGKIDLFFGPDAKASEIAEKIRARMGT
ncbi:MAG: SCO1/SenC family protein [Micavibrio sp.]|nr:SCO1/SenC family protein [Micavibrio sp.]